MIKRCIGIGLGFSLLSVVSCSSMPKEAKTAAVRGSLQGKTTGDVIFTQASDGKGVKMLANVSGLNKSGFHAAHIHENPTCEGDFKSAGGHFNPTDDIHGNYDRKEHHVGDLGNIKVNKDGTATVERVYKDLSLDPDKENYVGNRSFIIHSGADDYATQPTGGAGGRIGCAILQRTAE